MPGHQHTLTVLGEPHELLHLVRAHRGRLLDEDVLARGERRARELEVRRDRRGDDDRLHRRVGQDLAEVRRRLRPGMAPRQSLEAILGRIADPGEIRDLVEVADEVRAPCSEAGLCDPDTRVVARQSFHTFSLSIPLVALRKSKTTFARSTTSA